MNASRGMSLTDCLDSLRERSPEWCTAPEISASMGLAARYQDCRELATLVSRGMAEMRQLGGKPRQWRITALGAAWPEGRALCERPTYRVLVELADGKAGKLAEDPKIIGTLVRRDVIRRAGDDMWRLDPELLPFARRLRARERVKGADCGGASKAPASENSPGWTSDRGEGQNRLASLPEAIADNS